MNPKSLKVLLLTLLAVSILLSGWAFGALAATL